MFPRTNLRVERDDIEHQRLAFIIHAHLKPGFIVTFHPHHITDIVKRPLARVFQRFFRVTSITLDLGR